MVNRDKLKLTLLCLALVIAILEFIACCLQIVHIVGLIFCTSMALIDVMMIVYIWKFKHKIRKDYKI